MDILDELKQQKDANQENAVNTDHNGDEISTYQHSVLLGSLKKIHDYLFELTSHLNQLDHSLSVEIQIPDFGAISNLKQNDYELLWKNRARQNRVILNFCTHLNDNCRLDLAQTDTSEVEKLLADAGISYAQGQNALTLGGTINSSLTFSLNANETCIILKIENFKKLESHHYPINEKQINRQFFDQLGRYLLHRENNFIELISSQNHELSEHIEEDFQEDSGIHTQEMDISRVRSLFTREVQLYLTYHNIIKEINPRSGDFVMGRSRQCHLNINSDLASRQHAKIVFRKGKYVLIDQSTNGTFVKSQGGKEVYVQGEELPLSGSGFISLGKSVTVDNEHIIYFSCQ